MLIDFECPHCGASVRVAGHCAGRVASCSRCGSFATVPYGSLAAMPNGVSPKSPSESVDDNGVLFIAGPSPRNWAQQWLYRWWRWLAMLCVVIACVVAVKYMLVEPANDAARIMQCNCHLAQLGLALHNYHDIYGRFPPAYTTDAQGRPMHSWRVLILPYVEASDLYYRFDLDQPWDSPKNQSLLGEMPSYFQCPSADAREGCSNYVVIIGDGELPRQTIFAPDHSLSLWDIGEASSDTILVAEVRRAVPWTMPDADLHFEDMNFRINGSPASISSHHPNRAVVVLADGGVQILTDSLGGDEIRNLVRPANGEAGGSGE